MAEEEDKPKIFNDTDLLIGWMAGRVPPHALTGTFILKGTYDLHPGSVMTPSEEPLPLDDEVFHDEEETNSLLYPGDYGLFKPRAEILVVGDCVAPRGKAVEVLRVEASLGHWSKAVAVIGLRSWSSGLMGGQSKPEPFKRIPLRYEFAYGGEGYSQNPVGRGHEGRVLPNVEDPEKLITSKAAPPFPAGFGPFPRTWPQRTRFMGTYDKKWLKENWPYFPPDFDWSHFNTAPPDQQFKSFFRGDESLSVTHMHADHPVYECSLPGVRPRWIVRQEGPKGEVFAELKLHLDTIWVDMKAEQATLVWRAVHPVAHRKLADVTGHYVAVEDLTGEVLPAEHHRQDFQKRLAAAAAAEETPADEEEEKEIEEGKELPPQGEAALEKSAEEIRKIQERARAAEGKVHSFLEKFGEAHPGAMKALEANRGNIGYLGSVLTYYRGLAGQHPKLAEEVGPPPLPDEELYEILTRPEPPWTRQKVKIQAPKGFDFAEQDLSNLDLSDLDLSGACLGGAVLSGANLRKTKLVGTPLAEAMLDGADLSGADLTEADLSGADFTGARLIETKLAGAKIEEADFSKADLNKADLSGVEGPTSIFAEATCNGADFEKASLKEADLSGAELKGADFHEADLSGALFKGARGPAAVFRGANLTDFKAASSSFPGANFRGIEGEGAIFQEANVDEAEFFGAKMPKANFMGASARKTLFSKADLCEARFDEADLRDAKALKVNLFKGCLEGAKLDRADFSASNLFEVEFYEAEVGKAVFVHANLKRTKLA
ncbi:MAG: DUF2169 family type VI secretion system accessory protein [Planctomycetota bacterium]